MRATALFAILLPALLSSAPAAAAETLVGVEEAPIRVLVLDFKTKDKRIDASLLDTVAGLVAAQLADHPRFDVISGQEVRRLVELEGEKQATGCETDASCLAEIANAMGARLIVMGQLGRLGSLIVLNLSLYDSDEGRTVARAAVKSPDLDSLPDALEPELDEMVRRFQGVEAAPSQAATASPATASPATSSPATSPTSSSSQATSSSSLSSSPAAGAGAEGARPASLAPPATVAVAGGPDVLGMSLAAGAAGGGALLGVGGGIVLQALTSGGLPLGKLDSPEEALMAGLYPGLFAYLGAGLGAALFCDLIGVQVVGVASGVAVMASYLVVATGIVLRMLPRNEAVVLGGNALAATAGALTAAALAPFFLEEAQE